MFVVLISSNRESESSAKKKENVSPSSENRVLFTGQGSWQIAKERVSQTVLDKGTNIFSKRLENRLI